MKILLIGLGNIGLGLVVPIFKEAGYDVVGTDASLERINALRNDYFIITTKGSSKTHINTVQMHEIDNGFDAIVTSVGRRNLDKVAEWYRKRKLSTPVFLAENLPDPVSSFPMQIPIVVDRICPRIEANAGILSVVTEDYYKIVVLSCQVAQPLETVSGVELLASENEVEQRRKQKMFTINTAHVITALLGKQFSSQLFVEDAIAIPEIASKVRSVVAEVGPWLGFDEQEVEIRAEEIVRRFLNPIKDPIARILGPENRSSGLRYVEVPLNGVRSMGLQAPTLEEVYTLLTS